MRPIDGDALLKGMEESAQELRTIIDSLSDEVDEGIAKGRLISFLECKMRTREAPTLTFDDLRPKGRWNIVEFDKDSRRITIECSECGMVEEMTVMAYGFGHNFCHICGADMQGDGEE